MRPHRALDAIHLASALSTPGDLFVAYDQRLLGGAKAAGIEPTAVAGKPGVIRPVTKEGPAFSARQSPSAGDWGFNVRSAIGLTIVRRDEAIAL